MRRRCVARGGLGIGAGLALAMGGCGNGDPAHLVRQPIGPEGGLVSSYDGVLTIVLQPGALDDLYDVEVFPSDEPPVIFGPAYRVRPDLDLAVPAEVTYRRVLPSDPTGVAVAAIRIEDYEAEMGHWRPLPLLDLDLETDEVLATDTQLSLYYGLLSADDMVATSGADDDGGPGPGSATDTGDTGGSATDDGSDTGNTSSADTGPGPSSCGDGVPDEGEVCFVAMDHAMGAGPTDVTIGDFDGDDRLDVATSNGGAATISLRYGDGTGMLGGQNTETVGTGPSAIVSGDLDVDGDDDLVVALASGGAVLVAATGGGTYAVQPASDAGSTTVDLALVALDDDPQLDVVALAGGATPAIHPFLTTDTGLAGFGFVALDQVPGAPVGIAAASFNDGSGDMDGDAFAFGGGGYQGFDGTGAGALTPGGVSATLGRDLGRAFGGDFTGDGFADIAVVDRSGGGVYVLTGDGTATFSAGDLIATGSRPVDVLAVDLTHDGRADLVVVDADDDTVTIVAQASGGTFSVAEAIMVGSSPSGVAAGDLDGDGAIDLAVSLSGADAVTVLLADP